MRTQLRKLLVLYNEKIILTKETEFYTKIFDKTKIIKIVLASLNLIPRVIGVLN